MQPKRSFRNTILIILCCVCVVVGMNFVWTPNPHVSAQPLTLTQYVNPFIGTAPGGKMAGLNGNSGNTFPGAAFPLGMVQWSPDTVSNQPGGYYYPDTVIKGLSLTHFSGPGCTIYQDLPFMPYVGAITVSPATNAVLYNSSFKHSSELAHPGYYRVHLDTPNVTAELSATPHTGIGQFTYPSSTASTMLINAGGSVNGNSASTVTINPTGNSLTGSTTSTVSCGSSPYTVYFAAAFDQPFSSFGTWNGAALQPGTSTSTAAHTGAYVTFNTTSNHLVHVQVALSFVSLTNAISNLAAENASFQFATAAQAADTAWNARLSTIQVEGGSADEQSSFYTALYHVFLHPNIFNDANGQYLGFDGAVHTLLAGQGSQYTNIAGWEQSRSLISLRTLLFPAEASDIAQSLVNDAQQGDGHLPRWVQGSVDTRGLLGDSGSVLISEMYAFGARNFDLQSALSAMVHGQSKIREGYNQYINQGYVATNTSDASAAMTMEYANADLAISQFAGAQNDNADRDLFSSRSGDWRNLFNAGSKYVQPRASDGSWSPNFSPTSVTGFREGSSAQYSWLVPFDLSDLIARMGGNAAVISRLDAYFTKLNDGPASAYSFMGNEPGFEVPWEYAFAGAPWRTQAVTRSIETQLFTNTPAGLPGNDDGGSLSSWYVFAALGLYPEITGVGGFVIGSPLFDAITVQLPAGHSLQINAPGASDANLYILGMNINNKASSSLWLPWSSVQNGISLAFSMCASATHWGSGAGDAPPSYTPLQGSVSGFDNQGVSADSNRVANYDNNGDSYSSDALSALGIRSGGIAQTKNLAFSWPTTGVGLNDNWSVTGQQIPPPANSGKTLAFLGSATNGPASGPGTIVYTDGTLQPFTLAFSDWTLNGGSGSILPNNGIVAVMNYRNGPQGRQSVITCLFYMPVTLLTGKTLKSVILPASTNQGRLHVFSLVIK